MHYKIGAIIIVLALVLTGISVYSIENKYIKLNQEIEQLNIVIEQLKEISEYKDSFLRGCLGGTGTYEECSCTFEYIMDQVGLEEFINLMTNPTPNDIPLVVLGAFRKCIVN